MLMKSVAARWHLPIAAWLLCLWFLAGARPGSCAEAQIPSTPQGREAASKQFVLQRLQLWQKRMDLTQWHIRVDLVRSSQLEARTLGNIHWDMDTKEANIGVLSSYDYHMPYDAMLADMEFTIVHELVHLQLAALPRSEASRRVEEHAVNELARALLRLASH